MTQRSCWKASRKTRRCRRTASGAAAAHVHVGPVIEKVRQQFALTMNPCAYTKRLADEKPRERVYSDDELKKLWKAFGEIGTIGDLFKLQLLLAVRKGELVKME